MKKVEKLFLKLFLFAVFLFKLPNFYILPIQNAFFTSQALSRIIFILIFIIKIVELFFLNKKIVQLRNQKILVILIVLFFSFESLSILSATNIISFLSRYKELFIGFICFFDFYFYKKNIKKIIYVFLISTIINYLYQFFILFWDNQIINIISELIYQKHWQVVSRQLTQGKLQIDTYDEIIIPFLLLFIRKNQSLRSFFPLTLFLIIAFFSFLSNIRSRVLMLIIGFLGSLFLIKKVNKKIIFLLFLSLFFVSYISNFISLNILKYSVLDRILLRSEESTETVITRINQVKTAIDMGKSSFFGVGLGNYYDNLPASKKIEKYLYPKRQINYIGAISASEFIHNNFGLIIAETGYISLVVFIIILFYFIRNDLVYLKIGNNYQKAFVISFWTLFAFGLFNPVIPGSYNVLFWGIRGILL